MQFHQNTLEALRELLQSAGLVHPSQLRPHHIMRRVGHDDARPLSDVYRYVSEGALLQPDGARECGGAFATWWDRSRPDSFHPVSRG